MSEQSKEEQFNSTIADLVLALEKAGVYDDQLKETIDRLFKLRDLVLIKESMAPGRGFCHRCKYNENKYCIDLNILVTDYFGCSHFIQTPPVPKPPQNSPGL